MNFGVNNNVITCPYGKIKRIYSVGVHPKIQDSGPNEAENDDFDIRTTSIKGVSCVNHKDNICNRYLDLDKMNSTVTTACLDREFCTISDFMQFFKPEESLKREPNYSRCINDDATLYVQVFCLQSEE